VIDVNQDFAELAENNAEADEAAEAAITAAPNGLQRAAR
jgi:hypothetical protein